MCSLTITSVRTCPNHTLVHSGQVLHEPPADALRAAPSMDALDEFAHAQWEALQLYILTSSTDAPQLPEEVGTAKV